MFRSSYQSGLLSVLFSVGSKPLQLWEPHSTREGMTTTLLGTLPITVSQLNRAGPRSPLMI